MATISKRIREGRVRWLAQVRRVGHPHQSRTFDRRAEAEAWARETESQQDRGVVVAAPRQTLGALADRYLESEQFLGLAPAGQRNRRREVLTWLALLGRGCRLSEVTADGIEAGLKTLRERPGVRSTATLRNYLAGLGAVLDYGHRRKRWIHHNPLAMVVRPAPPRSRVLVLSDENLAQLEAVCRPSSDDRLWPMVAVSLSSALRQAELVALRWEAVNLDAGALLVLGKGRHGGRQRRAWISGRGLEALREFHLARGAPTSGPIWDSLVGRGGGRVYFPQWAWERAHQAAGLEDGFVWHSLRHTAATWFASLGASELEVQLFLGHSSPQIVRTYVHLGAVLRSKRAGDFVRRPLW